MKRFGQFIRLKSVGAEAYIRYHKEVWPKVLLTIKSCNMANYSIFIKDNCLFAYFEYLGSDFNADMAKMASDSETQRWWDLVKPLMEPIESRSQGEFWASMEEIFHLD